MHSARALVQYSAAAHVGPLRLVAREPGTTQKIQRFQFNQIWNAALLAATSEVALVCVLKPFGKLKAAQKCQCRSDCTWHWARDFADVESDLQNFCHTASVTYSPIGHRDSGDRIAPLT
eukprot:6214415-Pleurochrysis_carterae.AAC.2